MTRACPVCGHSTDDIREVHHSGSVQTTGAARVCVLPRDGDTIRLAVHDTIPIKIAD